MGPSTIPQGGPPPKKADHSALSLLPLSALLFVYGLGPDECVKLLAEVGADLNRKDNSGGLTALHMVAGYVKPGVVKLLEDIMEAGEEQAMN